MHNYGCSFKPNTINSAEMRRICTSKWLQKSIHSYLRLVYQISTVEYHTHNFFRETNGKCFKLAGVFIQPKCPVRAPVPGSACGVLWAAGWMNRPAPFPGRMSWKATKRGSVLSHSKSFLCCSLGPLWFCCIILRLLLFCLSFVLIRLSVPVQCIDWLERLGLRRGWS